MKMPQAERRPSGSVRSLTEQHPDGLPVFLSTATLIKLTIPALLGTLGIVSSFLFFYHRADVHISNPEIHVRAESKTEAKAARKELAKDIKRHVDVGQRELKVTLQEQIKNNHRTVMREVRATRSAMRRRR
jgi:hypothetical protein